MKNHSQQKGFTLMETLIYIALFGIIMVGAVVGTYNLLEGGNRNIDSTRIQEEGTFINKKINWALAGANSATILGGGTSISISRPDLGAQSPIIIGLTGNKMTLQRGTGVAVELNNDRFQISNVVFTYTASVNGRPPAVSANFQVGGKPFIYKNYLRQ